MNWASMESIIGLLIYIARKYRDMNPYLNRLPLTLDSWIICQDKEGWQLQGGELKISKLYGRWEGMEELNKPNLVIRVPSLR